MKNATFYAFKQSGKWYTSERGYLSEQVFKYFDRIDMRRQIVADNQGKFPGLSGPGNDFIFVVIGDDEINHGFPLMLFP